MSIKYQKSNPLAGWAGLKYCDGFGLVEVIVSLAILTIVMLGFHFLSRMAFYSWENAKNKSIAYNIIQDTVECFEHIRNTNVLDPNTARWSEYILDGVHTSDYVGGNGNDCILDAPNGFGRTITITDIPTTVATGTLSNIKKKIIVTVTWEERLRTAEVASIIYLTDWRGAF